MQVSEAVCGHFHQGDLNRFSQRSVGRQCMANCITAAIYAKNTNVSDWTRTTLDAILISGDRLYKETVKNDELLMVSDFGNRVEHGTKSYNLQTVYNIGGTMDGKHGSVSLRDAVNIMSQNDRWSYATLCISDQTARGTTVLLLTHGDECYLFDSHSRDICGQQVSDGTSVLLNFNCLQNMVTYLLQQATSMHFEIFDLTIIDLQETNPMMDSYFQKQQELKQSHKEHQAKEYKKTIEKRTRKIEEAYENTTTET